MQNDLYEILQVSHYASQEVIEAAYRRLAQQYHPDVNKSPSAHGRMEQLNAAYEVLRDETRRADWDGEWARERAAQGTTSANDVAGASVAQGSPAATRPAPQTVTVRQGVLGVLLGLVAGVILILFVTLLIATGVVSNISVSPSRVVVGGTMIAFLWVIGYLMAASRRRR